MRILNKKRLALFVLKLVLILSAALAANWLRISLLDLYICSLSHDYWYLADGYDINYTAGKTISATAFDGSILPLAVDLRSEMAAVRDQDIFPTCSEFAVCSALSIRDTAVLSPAFINSVLRYYMKLDTLDVLLIFLDKIGIIKWPRISARPHLYYQNITSALEAVRLHGVCLEADYPYSWHNMLAFPDSDIIKKAEKYRIEAHGSFIVGNYAVNSYMTRYPVPGYFGVNQARMLLAQGRALVVSMHVNEAIRTSLSTECPVTFKGSRGPYVSGHALVVAGYNDTLITDDGRGAFYMINSWGSNGRHTGYEIVSYREMARQQYDKSFYWIGFDEEDYKEINEVIQK